MPTTTMVSVCLPARDQDRLNTASCAVNELEREVDRPRVPAVDVDPGPAARLPVGPYQTTRRPVNVKVAVAPARVA